MRLPNQLTWLRIACIPVVVILLLEGAPVLPGADAKFEIQNVDILAAIVFGLAALTDFFDGWLARRFGAQSLLGKLLDPLADKLLVVASMIILVEKQRLAGWIAVVLIVRDLGINAIRLAAMDEKIMIESSQLGKVKTFFLDLGIAGLMVHGTLWYIPWLLIGQISIGVAVASSLISAGLYLYAYAAALRTRG
jgi:CDP-diacylglycerol--glycerol-3-phosphate 3-phosphatidyltransferase